MYSLLISKVDSSCRKHADVMFVSQGKNAELRVCGDCCICRALECFALRLLCLNAEFICELPGKVSQQLLSPPVLLASVCTHFSVVGRNPMHQCMLPDFWLKHVSNA